MDWVKLYHNDFLNSYSFQKMTPAEKGLYCNLLFLMAATRDGVLRYDVKNLARNCNTTPTKFRKVFENICSNFEFFEVKNDGFCSDFEKKSQKFVQNELKTNGFCSDFEKKSQKFVQNELKTNGFCSDFEKKCVFFFNSRMKKEVEEREAIEEKARNGGRSGGKGNKKEVEENESTPLSTPLSNRKIDKKERKKDIPPISPNGGQEENDNPPKMEIEELGVMWNKFAEENDLEGVSKLSQKRIKAFKARQKAFAKFKPSANTREFWEIVLQGVKAKSNGWWLGRNEKGWKINFDALLKNDERIDGFINSAPLPESEWTTVPPTGVELQTAKRE